MLSFYLVGKGNVDDPNFCLSSRKQHSPIVINVQVGTVTQGGARVDRAEGMSGETATIPPLSVTQRNV